MPGFVKRKTNTTNPAGGVNPAQAPNVGQFGWTSFDAGHVNQIIGYVDICKQLAQQTKDYADYVAGRFGELEGFMSFIEEVYKELKPIVDQIQPIYADIIERHEDIITRHIDVIKLHGEVTQDKVEINQIKDDAIAEATKIKDDTVAETNAIKLAAVAETTAIKNQATAEVERARLEADRAASEAIKSANSAIDSAKSATASGTEAGKAAASAKEAADIAEELRKGQVYRGTWNIESNKAYPPKPDTNSVWDITLNEGSASFVFDGNTWYWGDRLLYLKDDNKFSQIESGSGVLSVNGKSGAVTLTAEDVGAVKISGDTMKGNLELEAGKAQLILNTNYVKGYQESVVLRDHGNGNVTLSAGVNADGNPGTLYLGYNGKITNQTGYNTKDVRLDSPMSWRGTTSLITGEGKLNSEAMIGPIRTERDDAGVWHTVVGGTDTVNRGRTIIAGGEAGKHIADAIPSAAEQVHIGGDDSNGVFIHTGLQTGYAGSTHHRHWFNQGNLYSQKMDGTTQNKFYHNNNKPTPTELGVVNKAGDTSIGDLTLASGKILNATLTHQRGYMSIYPYNSSYGGGETGNRCRLYYKEHNNGNPSDISRGIVINSTNADGTSYPMDLWLNGQKVYHGGYKPTASDVNALPISGGTMTGHIILTDDKTTIRNPNGAELLRISGNATVLGNSLGRSYINSKDNPVVRTGGNNTEYKIYHEGNKPTLADVIGDNSSTKKTYTIAKPSGVADGKYYPVLFIGTTNYPDVMISTTSSAATSSMNNCSFKGQVVSGGFSDKGQYATGNFHIFDTKERSIHSIVGSSEGENHYVFYVEARAFPLTVVVDSKVEVSCSGKDMAYGSSTYKAGLSGMTASGDFGTKTSLILDLVRGSGFYGGPTRTMSLDANGYVNASSRMLVDAYNDAGAYLTRRAGKTNYAMMGQGSSEEAMLGTGTSTSAYKSYVKVSPSGISYSANGTAESRVYHEGFKPSLGELGGIAATGGTMTGALNWRDTNKYVNSTGDNMYLAAKLGAVVLEGKFTPMTRVNGTTYNMYHQGYKPSAADVGALSTSGGTITGRLTIKGASSHIDLVETDSADKTWRIEAQSGNLDLVEAGVANRFRIHAGGGATLSGNLSVGGHVTVAQGNILKFPSKDYATGAQIYTRDGGQYGSNFVINTGGNMILGAGECGTAMANELGASASEHAFVLADGDVNIMPGANVIADKKTHKFGSDGNVSFNAGSTLVRTYYGDTKNYIARSADNMYVAANGGSGRVYLEGAENPIARIAGKDHFIYHSGNKPTIDDIAGGKAIGASQALGVVDLDDFITPGVWHQGSNAQATSGQNYPVSLAGSLVVYQAAGVVQEYRVYNSTRCFRRAKYQSEAWRPWAEEYNTSNIPSPAVIGALPSTGGTVDGSVTIKPAQAQNGLNLWQTPNTGSNAVGISGWNGNGSAVQWGCGMLYNGGNPTYAYYGTGASPWANGLKVYPDRVETQGNFGAIGGISSGGTITTADTFRVNKSEWPSIELHRVGTFACLATVDSGGNYVVGGSNGAGSLGAAWMTMGGAQVTFNGKVVTNSGTTRSWLSKGTASFVGPEIPVSAGNLVASTSQRIFYSGVAALEYGRGYYIDGSAVNNWAHAFFANDGASYNRFWLFRNNGGQQSPSNFSIDPDGRMAGNAYGGYDDHFHWSIANLGATTDARMTKAIGRSTKSALSVIDQLSVNKLVWNEDAGSVHTTRDVKVTEFGLIAQEVEEVSPSLVKTIRIGGETPTETKTLDTAAMLALALKAIQELQEEVRILKEGKE